MNTLVTTAPFGLNTASPHSFPTLAEAAGLPQDAVVLSTNPAAGAAKNPPGRIAAGVGGAVVCGAGLGYLGATAGANVGFAIGIGQPVSEGVEGLGEMFVNGLHAAAWGELIGGVVYLGVGVAAGALLATALYDRFHH